MKFLLRKILNLLYGSEKTVYVVQRFQYGVWSDLKRNAVFPSRAQAEAREEHMRENFPRELYRVTTRKGRI